MNITPISSTVVPPSALAESAYRGPCRILGAHITRVIRGGGPPLIFCPEYCEAGGICQLRKTALERRTGALTEGSPEDVGPGGIRCIMLSA